PAAPPPPRGVAPPPDLVAAADPQDHRAARGRAPELGPPRRQVGADDLLDPVGPPAQDHQTGVGGERFADLDVDQADPEPPPFGSPGQGQDVAAVAVRAQQPRIQVHDDQVGAVRAHTGATSATASTFEPSAAPGMSSMDVQVASATTYVARGAAPRPA